MKATCKICLTYLLILTFYNQTDAQTDSVRTEYAVENAEKSDFTFHEKYVHFASNLA